MKNLSKLSKFAVGLFTAALLVPIISGITARAEPGRATQRDGGMKTLPTGTHHHSGYGLMENATTSEQMVTCIQADM